MPRKDETSNRSRTRRGFLTASASAGAAAVALGATTADADAANPAIVVGTAPGDYPDLHTAIAAAPETGANILVRHGVHTIDRSVNVRSNLTIAGEGEGSLLRAKDALDDPILVVPAGTSDVVIRDLKIDGNQANQQEPVNCIAIYGSDRIKVSGVHAVEANGYNITTFPPTSRDVQFLNCVTENARDENLEMRAVEGGSIIGCISRSPGKNGIYVWAGTETGTDLKDVVIAENIVTGGGPTFSGICVDERCRGVLVSTNTVVRCLGRGITVSGESSDVAVSSNLVEGCGGLGIAVETASDVLVSGNTVQDSAVAGIRVAHGRGFRLEGNASRRNGGAGIEMLSTTESGASGNSCTGNLGAGIRLSHVTGGYCNSNSCGANGGPQASGISIASSSTVVVGTNLVQGSGSSGIDLNKCSDCTVSANVSRANRHSGVLFLDTTDSTCTGNLCADNGKDLTSAWQRSGITLWESARRCRDVLVSANRCHDSQATKTQSYGISVINRPQNVLLSANLVEGNGVAGVRYNAGAENTHIVPYRRLDVVVGTTQVAIPHGLPQVPRVMTFAMSSPGSIWRSQPSDTTNVYLLADAAGRSAQLTLG